MNTHVLKPTPIKLIERVEIELKKCEDIRAQLDVLTDDGARGQHALLLGRLVFWACIAIEELHAARARPVGLDGLSDVVALRDGLPSGPASEDVALRAHDRLRALVARGNSGT